MCRPNVSRRPSQSIADQFRAFKIDSLSLWVGSETVRALRLSRGRASGTLWKLGSDREASLSTETIVAFSHNPTEPVAFDCEILRVGMSQLNKLDSRLVPHNIRTDCVTHMKTIVQLHFTVTSLVRELVVVVSGRVVVIDLLCVWIGLAVNGMPLCGCRR